LHGFIASYVRYQTHVNAYLALAANPFPSFTGAPGYPIDLTVAPPDRQSRLTVLFRFFLAIPAFIFVSIVQWIGQIVTVIAWFVCLITGRMPQGMRAFLVYWIRFNAQTTGYLCLLTGRYPRFTYE
jgi:magnesium-transporting ATPase (P-type)